MARQQLATLVVGYDDVDIAMTDFQDLAEVHREHRVGDYEAAVVRRITGRHDLVATTVDATHRATLFGAGLGVVVGVVISPVLAAVVLGAGFGAVAGDIVEKYDALKHADMSEVEQVVDASAANLIVIAEQATLDDIAKAATSRGRRASVPFSHADIRLLERELRRATT
jgi:uncharacterized membrane protein